jgi:hypothetical protein
MSASKNSSQKDIIYVDIDDEITGIIEKVRDSSHKIVALVLPKRATVMQSIVNMKLLKRTASESKKNIVLITSEAALLPVAGIVGLHVAKTLQSKPEIPSAPATPGDTPILADGGDTDAVDTPVDKSKSVGELAGLPPSRTPEAEDDAIEVDNDDEPDPDEKKGAAAALAAKLPFNKRLRVPDFDKFRVRLFLGVCGVLLLIIGWFVAFHVLPKATVIIKTDTVSVTSDIVLTGQTTAKEANEQQMIVPAMIKEYKKTDTQKTPATGQKNVGTKSTGTMTLYNCTDNALTVPAGSQFTNSGLSFVSSDAVTVPPSDFFSNGNCKLNRSADVAVTAAQPGDNYNLSGGRSYTSAIASTLTGKGSSMTGGTSKMVKVVSQQDVDGAKQKVLENNNTAANQEVSKQLKADGYLPLTDTFAAGNPLVTSSPNVDSEATDVTVTVATTYTMYGAKQDAVTGLLEKDIKSKIDTAKQAILNNGLDKAIIRITDKNATQVKFGLQTVATAGVQQDSAESIKKAIAGKKKGEVHDIILARPGVKDVTVDYSPFWVYTTPSKTSKITIIFQQSDGNTGR